MPHHERHEAPTGHLIGSGVQLSRNASSGTHCVVDFPEHLYQRLSHALRDAAPPRDVYALSLWFSADDDEPTARTVELSWNTEERVRYALECPVEERLHQWWFPSDEAEARWNFAFWLQDQLTVVGGRADPAGAALWLTWCDSVGLTPPEDDGTDEYYEWSRVSEARFVQVCVAAARRLHEDGVVVAVLGRPVPVILHDLEYYDDTVAWALAANPPAVAEDAVAWMQER